MTAGELAAVLASKKTLNKIGDSRDERYKSDDAQKNPDEPKWCHEVVGPSVRVGAKKILGKGFRENEENWHQNDRVDDDRLSVTESSESEHRDDTERTHVVRRVVADEQCREQAAGTCQFSFEKSGGS